MNNEAARIITTAAKSDEEKGDRMVEAGLGMDPAEAARSRARAEYWSWKVLGTPVAVSLGAAANIAAPGTGKHVTQGFNKLSQAQLERATRELERLGVPSRAPKGKPVSQVPATTIVPQTRSQLLQAVARTAAALVQVESNGNPDAVSKSGSYVGLLQMGDRAATDVGITKESLLGDPRAALIAWLRYQILYRKYTGFIPQRMAILWKGGPGTAKKFAELKQTGASDVDAIAAAAPASWNLPEYMRRFNNAWARV